MVEWLCHAERLPPPVREYRFHPTRRWRFDYAWPSALVAVEVNGGIWTRGRHSRGTGQLADFEKLNTAQTLGWIVLQTTPQTLHLLTPFLREALR